MCARTTNKIELVMFKCYFSIVFILFIIDKQSTNVISVIAHSDRAHPSAEDNAIDFQSQYQNNWIIANKNKSIQIVGTVPGGVYSDLLKSGYLRDLYKDNNDVESRWVAKDEWTYTLSYEVSNQTIHNKQHLFVTFLGLDTVASILINGVKVGQTDNMFVRYRYDVKSLLNSQNLTIQVQFKSPITEAEERFLVEQKRRDGVGVPPFCVPSIYNGECHVNHLRKQQASFAWDWGPAIPNVGLWKDVLLEAYDTAIIRSIRFSTKPSDKNFRPMRFRNSKTVAFTPWVTNITVCLEGKPNNQLTGSYDLRLFDLNKTKIWSEEGIPANVVLDENGEAEIQRIVTIDKNVQLWWPNGIGDQTLYSLEVVFNSREEHSKKTINVGFRTIDLVQSPINPDDPTAGLLFFLKINGIPTFMKGSNWIPANILPEIPDTAEGRRVVLKLLLAAQKAHMNMLRVWGGGVYESDYFYELTDRLGILIWQDFMFACSMYPTNEEFLRSVQMEIAQQVNRLQHHASVAVWAGNNENELALRQNWYQTIWHYKTFKEDYIALYVDLIKRIVEKLDTSRPFVVSSPSNGKKSEEEGYVASNPGGSLFGDVHFYDYVRDTWNENTFPTPRFASEYGVQSLPSFSTWFEATSRPKEDLVYTSAFLKHRQHSPLGYMPISWSLTMHFPKIGGNETEENLKRHIYYSQIHQAMSIKIQTEKYRRFRNTINAKNEGGTMGALYWQLNDVWQAPSWSGIDFAGRWKMLHYFAQKFFSPVLVSPSILNYPTLEVSTISDLLDDINNASLNIHVFKWSSFSPVTVKTIQITVQKNVALVKYRTDLAELLKENNCTETDSLLYFNLKTSNGDIKGADNFLLPAKLKFIDGMQKPDFRIQVFEALDDISNNYIDYKIRIYSKSIALFVWLETHVPGTFSDNGFLMVAPVKEIYFYSDLFTSVDELTRSIKITSFINS